MLSSTMKKVSSFLIFILLGLTVNGCGESDDDSMGNEPVNPDPKEEVGLPFLSIKTVVEKEDDGTTFDFIAQLSNSIDQEVSVDFNTESGTAITGEDFSETFGTLVFLPGETEKLIQVEINNDNLVEEDENFTLRLSNINWAILLDSLVVAHILNDDVAPYDGFISPMEYEGYELVWQEEFSGPEINLDHWNHELGNSGWGNNELQNYTKRPDNSYIEDGKLIIEAKNESFGGSDYTSARMISAGKKEFQYGRVDVRAKLPEGQGIWPAIWMLGNNIWTDGWPSCGEIDIMELVGHQPSTVHGTIHWSDNGNHAYFGGDTSIGFGKFSNEFYVFSIIWDESSIRWLLNNVEYHVVDVTSPQLTEFHNEFFFILNVAVGGNWPGYPDASTVFPQKMYIDYIRVFQ